MHTWGGGKAGTRQQNSPLHLLRRLAGVSTETEAEKGRARKYNCTTILSLVGLDSQAFPLPPTLPTPVSHKAQYCSPHHSWNGREKPGPV
ncbi:hypothetical protein AGOR_G00004350 [Albula goreensis]|uniref:Uncharacterized protein n=1 Tax=Albula goreensis TaxID=1534307 RepID=A0A8T3E6G3_9TELE|nr:hypothetical protein AGOR_G00004350 [Albula goreensis]